MTAPTIQPLSVGRPAGVWGLSWSGVRTVATLELRQRVRSTRWIVVLVIWVGVLGLLTTLIRWSVQRSYSSFEATVGGTAPLVDAAARARLAAEQSAQAGRITFGIIVFLVLSLGALVAPALSATSINGDRAAGVLATLQTTLLTPAEIVAGKLLAAWAVALGLLVGAAPFIIWAYVDGGTPAGRLLVVLGLLALTLLVVCAVGLGWSAIAARTSSSAVLTYLTVALLGLGLPLLFALALPMVTQEDRIPVTQSVATNNDGSTFTCQTTVQVTTRQHTERIWWLLAASPYVVLADAAPRPTVTADGNISGPDDPLSVIRAGVREARLGPPDSENWCGSIDSDAAAREQQRLAQREALGVTWPYGLAADLLLASAFVVVAVRRLRAPARVLPRGTRVA